jgi:hypothetical protein
MMLGAFSMRRLPQGFGERNEAKLCANAFPGIGHFGRSLGLQGCFLKLADICEPFVQSVFNLLDEHGL